MTWLTLLLALAGCKMASTATTDAPPPEDATALADAPPDVPVGPVGPVTVTITNADGDGHPDATAIVIFMDGAAHVLSTATADASGVATGAVPAGALVTVLQVYSPANAPNEEVDALTTVRGVQPGDHLRVGRLQFPVTGIGNPEIMTTTITPVTPGNPPGLMTACSNAFITGGPTATAQFTFYDNCRPSTFDVFGLQGDRQSGFTYLWQAGVAYVTGGSFTLDAPWQPAGTSRITATNTPANLARLVANLTIFLDGLPLSIDQENAELPAPGTATISLLRTTPDAPTRGVLQLSEVDGIGPFEMRARFGTAAALAADQTFDLSTQPLPLPKGVAQSDTGVSWSLTGAPAGDVRIVRWLAQWGSTDPTTSVVTSHFGTWLVVEDATLATTATSLPSLPAAYVGKDPTAVAAVALFRGGASVTYLDYDNLDGFDGARASTSTLIDIALQFPDVDHDAHATVGGTPQH